MGSDMPENTPSAVDEVSTLEELIAELTRPMIEQIHGLQCVRKAEIAAWRTTFNGERLIIEPIYADQLWAS